MRLGEWCSSFLCTYKNGYVRCFHGTEGEKASVCDGSLYSEKTQSTWCLCTRYMILCAILR